MEAVMMVAIPLASALSVVVFVALGMFFAYRLNACSRRWRLRKIRQRRSAIR